MGRGVDLPTSPQTTRTGNLTAGAVMSAFEAKYGKTLSTRQDSAREVAGEGSEYDDLRKVSRHVVG